MSAPDVTIPEGFSPLLSLSGEPLGSGLFSHFYSQGATSFGPVTDPELFLHESFPGLGVSKADSRSPAGNGFSPEISQPQSQQLAPSPGSTPHSEVSPQTHFLQQFMKDLLELDMELIRHVLEDPVVYDPSQITPATSGTKSPQSISECAVDTTFLLTQRLIKILRRGVNSSAEPAAAQNVPWQSPLPASSSFSSRFQQLVTNTAHQSPHGIANIDFQQPELRLDQGSLLHALSTYMRLIEAYHNTFSQTAERFGRALADGAPIPLPALQIGAFSMDDSASHIAVVIQSALRLLDRLGDLVNQLTIPFIPGESGDVDSSLSPASNTHGASAIKLMMTAVRERESQLMQAAARLQSCCPENRHSYD